jgi:hypothetical protein
VRPQLPPWKLFWLFSPASIFACFENLFHPRLSWWLGYFKKKIIFNLFWRSTREEFIWLTGLMNGSYGSEVVPCDHVENHN